MVERAGLPDSAIAVFLSSLAFNTVVALIIFVLFGGRELLSRKEPLDRSEQDGVQSDVQGGVQGGVQGDVHGDVQGGERDGERGGTRTTTLRPTRDQILTVVGLLVLGVGALAFDLEVGFVSITVAVLLAILSPQAQKGAVEKISWSTVLLISGVITYVGVLEKMGTIKAVGEGVAHIGAPLITALLLCYIGAIVSAFASSVGVLGSTIPLAVPFLLMGEVGAVGVIAALAVSSTIVDCSPFSTNGALVLANAQGVDRDAFFRKLIAYGAVIVMVAPLATWLVLVLPGWL